MRPVAPSRVATLACFAKPSMPRALWQLANTLIPFLASWTAAVWSWQAGWSYFATAAFSVFAAGTISS